MHTEPDTDPTAAAQRALLQELREHLRAHPHIQGQPLLLHQRGALLDEIRQSRAYRAEGHPSFRAFCSLLGEEFSSAQYSSAAAAIAIAKGYLSRELSGSRASARLLTDLLAVPRPRRAQLLRHAEGLNAAAVRALVARALAEEPAAVPAPPEEHEPPAAPDAAPPQGQPTPGAPADQTELDRRTREYLEGHDAFVGRMRAVLRRWNGGETLCGDLLVLLRHAVVESRTLYTVLVESTAKEVAQALAESHG